MTTMSQTVPAANDPAQARAEFFLDLELLELVRVIPQASAVNALPAG